MSTYDYVVVGAGSAGCVVAARLSENPDRRVLLLEAGPATRPVASEVPSRFLELLGSEYDWGYTTVPQDGTAVGVHYWPRGKLLGGTGAINALAFVRGDRSVFDGWEADGADGWSYADMLPFFKRSEHTEGRDPAYRGTGGPLWAAPVSARHPVSEALYDAVVACGYPSTEDLNGADQYGVGWWDVNIVDGSRLSTADAYLRPHLARPNLTVISDALVHRLRVEDDRCEGVVYGHHGQSQFVSADREVILCAGTIGSPQLLMLSGVGPADHLRALGIPVVADLPGVGTNLHDHIMSNVVYAVDELLPASVNNHSELTALLRTEDCIPNPDIQIQAHLIPYSPALVSQPEHGYSIAVSVAVPHSRGTVRLAGGDVRQKPLIDPRYLNDERDIDILVAGLLIARRIGSAPPFSRWKATEVTPTADDNDAAGWRAIVRRGVSSEFHPVGTCHIGVGGLAVVDPGLRVHGVAGLRVADASVMPSITSLNPNATVIAIAERAAILIAEDSAA